MSKPRVHSLNTQFCLIFLQIVNSIKYLNDLLEEEGSTHDSEHIGPSTPEEDLATLITCSLPPAVNAATVHCQLKLKKIK